MSLVLNRSATTCNVGVLAVRMSYPAEVGAAAHKFETAGGVGHHRSELLVAFLNSGCLHGPPFAGMEKSGECRLLTDAGRTDRYAVNKFHRLGQRITGTHNSTDAIPRNRKILRETLQGDKMVGPVRPVVQIVGGDIGAPVGPIRLVEHQHDVVFDAQIKEVCEQLGATG